MNFSGITMFQYNTQTGLKANQTIKANTKIVSCTLEKVKDGTIVNVMITSIHLFA
ncbi:hypothetical protein HOLleu_44930 [Holothuria leucospilota]|uniref:Uncharacterized protein n=1 Tax=Holothuria leucospilota TaxID=206669 RepID=A0A9Q0YFB2_HOLLE|nr:hypothetical protein HOLleu_44930 [Holothuria leucospilota]